LASTSTDDSSALTGFAWDVLGNGTFAPGGSVLSTTFTTAGAHHVSLRVAAADGQTSTVTQTITVRTRRLGLMQPFPVIRIAGSDSASGARISVLTAQVPVGAHATVTCRGHGCPRKPEVRVARSAKPHAGVVVLAFRRFQRSLPAGVVLEVRVYKAGMIGKYTSFRIRRSRLPVRVDACVGPTGGKPFTCPT
jgi:PKD repeat protein